MINVCTSFSQKGYAIYGKAFIESFLKHTDKSVKLWVFHEGKKPSIKGPRYVDLTKDPDRQAFLERHRSNISAQMGIVNVGGVTMKDYRFQAIRFCHKVFAMTYPKRPKGTWVWCDADVMVVRDLNKQFWSEAAPEDQITYLGRRDWDHSETGWIGFGEDNSAFLRRLREIYTTDELFTLPGWTDSFAFDRVLDECEDEAKNLSEGVEGNDVWPHTVLGTVMIHNKGLRKFEVGNAIRAA